MAVKKASTESAELTTTHRHEVSINERFSDDQLRAVTSFEDAVKLAAQAYGSVDNITDYELGNGFRLLKDDDRDRLVGESFIVLHYTFNEGNFNEFVSCVLVTQHNDRFIMNGGVQIVEQLQDIAKTGRYGGIMVPHGLRKSEYDTCAGKDCGKPRKPSVEVCEHCGDTQGKRAKGKTYYLDVSE